jgi:superfamily II DNA or RNA helicase
VTLRSVDEEKIVAVVRSNGIAPQVAIEWGGGTGPQGVRAVCGCGGAGICPHAIAALETVRTHVDDDPAPPESPDLPVLDWLPATTPAAATARARSVWPVFSSPDRKTLVCSLFLDTPRLRGVLREAEAIVTMVDQTPVDDWDESDRALLRDPAVVEAFGARPNLRALAQTMFRLVRHPRVRYDDNPELRRHPAELIPFAIDPRGVRLVATFRGTQPLPLLETLDGDRIDLASAVLVEGPPAWICDGHGAYLLDVSFDAPKAARAIEAARSAPDAERLSGTPSLATIARVAAFLSTKDRIALGIDDARDPVGRLNLRWRDGALVVRATFVDLASGAAAGLGALRTGASLQGAVATAGERLVRFSPEVMRALVDRLVGAGFVPRTDGTLALHGAERAALFVRETLPSWDDVEVELDATLDGVSTSRPLDLSIGARRSVGTEDWFELDVNVFVDGDGESGEALSRDELRELLAGQGRYAEVRGRLVDVGDLREREVLLGDLLDRQKTGLAALVALRDEIHESFGNVRLPEEVEALRERVRNFGGIAHVDPPGNLGNVLRDYQKRGLDFLTYLSDFRFGGILADEMGLGKSVETLSSLLYRRDREGRAPSLIIAPTSVMHTWENEIAKFTPQLSALLLQSGNGRAARYEELANYDVVITSYAIARLDAEKLAKLRFRTIILDEAQNAKNPSSQISKVVRTLRADHRLALTGTPVENSLRDLWAIFAFLEPGLLGTETSFRRRFETPIANGDAKATASLHARLEPFVLRRTKEDVAPELPERTETEIVVDLSPTQRTLYRAIAEAARREILDDWDSLAPEKASIHVLAALTRLRQVCAHPGLLSEKYLTEPESSAKFDALIETIEEIIDGRHKVLVFSAFASMLRIIRSELDRRETRYAYLDGSTKEKDRRVEVARFMGEDGPPVFLCSLKAGGVGLTLTAADYVVLYDPWWNPAVERQAIDRTHRIGQQRPVTAYRLLARGSIEEKIRALASRKHELSENIIRADAAMAKTLTREDLEFLFADPD